METVKKVKIFKEVTHRGRVKKWPFGNFGIGMLALALASAFKYEHCLLQNFNRL